MGASDRAFPMLSVLRRPLLHRLRARARLRTQRIRILRYRRALARSVRDEGCGHQQAERQWSGSMSNLDFDWQDDPAEPRAVSAQIVPFPMARRVAFLNRMAVAIASCRKSQPYRERAEQQQRDAMRRRGLSEEMIEAELAIFNREIDRRLGAMGHGQGNR